jgi:hypothetical protein
LVDESESCGPGESYHREARARAPPFLDMAGVACDDRQARMQARARHSCSAPPRPFARSPGQCRKPELRRSVGVLMKHLPPDLEART